MKEKSLKEKELEEDIHIQDRVSDKKKSANERELERYMKEDREKQIEYRLKCLRKKRADSIWKTTLMKNNTKLYIDNTLNRERNNFLHGGWR
jgi:hypothetical protein